MIKEPLEKKLWDTVGEGYYDECITFLKSGNPDLVEFFKIKKKCDAAWLEYLDYIEAGPGHYGPPPPDED